MGGGQSQSLKNYVENNVAYNNIISQQIKLNNQSITNFTNINKFIMHNGGAQCCELNNGNLIPGCTGDDAKFDCANFTLDQSINQKVTVVQNIDSRFTQDITNNLQTQATSDFSNALDQLQAGTFAGTFQGEKQDVENAFSTQIKDTFKVEDMTTVVNSAVINSYSANNAQIINCGTITGTDSCTIDEDIQINVLVNNILSAIGSMAENNTALNTMYTQVQNALSQTQVSTSSLIIIAIIAGIVLLLIIVVVIIIFSVKKPSLPGSPSPVSAPSSIELNPLSKK